MDPQKWESVRTVIEVFKEKLSKSNKVKAKARMMFIHRKNMKVGITCQEFLEEQELKLMIVPKPLKVKRFVKKDGTVLKTVLLKYNSKWMIL